MSRKELCRAVLLLAGMTLTAAFALDPQVVSSPVAPATGFQRHPSTLLPSTPLGASGTRGPLGWTRIPSQEPTAPELPRPLEEIIQHFAQKELEYAQAHAGYAYRLSIKVQEIDGEGKVLGEFTEVLEVGLSPTGRRIDRVAEEPFSSLQHLGIKRVELFDLGEVPLFSVRPEDLLLYRFDYLGSEQLDEVNTFIFRATPSVVPRDRVLFEGLLWVDAEKLDVVKLFGRSLPARRAGVLKDYFQRVEAYREPVDSYLFPIFIQGDDILRVGEETLRARLILRFSDHKRLPPPPAPPQP